MKKFLIRISILIVLVLIGYILFVYYAQYSSGVRSGVVVKISQKGVLFKTSEGQLNLQSFGAVKKEDNQLSEVFEFSVDRAHEDIYQTLQDVSLTGERVSLHYVQRYAALPWRGETNFFVMEVERGDNPTPSEGREDPLSH